MNPEEFIHLLENDPENLPVSGEVAEVLVANSDYVKGFLRKRKEHRFLDRTEIGEHRREFQEVTGLNEALVNHFLTTVGSQTLKTQKTLEREQTCKEAHKKRVTILEATLEYLEGNMSVAEASQASGVHTHSIYKLLKKLQQEWEFTLDDLDGMRASKRKALAIDVEKTLLGRYNKHLERQLSVREE